MRWLVLTTMVLFAATCGQKGPLTHPEPQNSSGIELMLMGQHGCAVLEQHCLFANQRLQQQ